MLNVFFSHGTADRVWVDHIKNSIENGGIRVYMYENDSKPGALVAEKLQRAIDQSDVVITLLTRHSHRAPYVQQEIGYARGKNKLVIPLVEKGEAEASLAMLTGHEWITFDVQNMDECSSKLTTFLRARLNRKELISAAAGLVFLILALYLLYSVQGGGNA